MIMAETHLKGNPIQTSGKLPEAGDVAPDFKGVAADLSEGSLGAFKGKNVLINVFPSVDTPVCAMSVRRFYQELSGLDNTVVLNVSMDLPFAHKRFCASEGLENVHTLSDFRYAEVADQYGLRLSNGPMAGLLARAVFVVGADGLVRYSELVPEITQEPDYAAALAVLKA
jgi:thiol peroxidase